MSPESLSKAFLNSSTLPSDGVAHGGVKRHGPSVSDGGSRSADGLQARGAQTSMAVKPLSYLCF